MENTTAPVMGELTASQTEILLKGLELIQRNSDLTALQILPPIAVTVSQYFRARAEYEKNASGFQTPQLVQKEEALPARKTRTKA